MCSVFSMLQIPIDRSLLVDAVPSHVVNRLQIVWLSSTDCPQPGTLVQHRNIESDAVGDDEVLIFVQWVILPLLITLFVSTIFINAPAFIAMMCTVFSDLSSVTGCIYLGTIYFLTSNVPLHFLQ